MGAFWDIVARAANIVQLLGLDAVTLITMASTFLLLHEMVKMECRKLEERAGMLGALLRSPSGRRVMTQQQDGDMELERLMINALKDAHDLVECYSGGTLFARVRRGRSMAAQFRDLRSSIDCYCGLILSVNAFLLAVQGNQLPPPPPTLVRTTRVNDVRMTKWTGDPIDAEAPTPAAAAALPDDAHIIDTRRTLRASLRE